MLRLDLIHPPLLAALARAGHGSKVLLADANYPAVTASNPAATIIELSITRDLPTVSMLLELIRAIVPVEAAHVMSSGGTPVPAHVEYQAALSPLRIESLARQDFYAAARTTDVGVIVTSGDTRHFANLMLTVGVA
jgi:L-fucose mutarotase